ncbi:MAG UNVERIFIED_CONTAM: hypothetical protein LVR18_23335 [Planctomycetaceae bacterium]
MLKTTDFHLTRETDTEVLNHLISHELSVDPEITPVALLQKLAARVDGSWNIVYLNARGQMFVSRDPLGMRPLCWAHEGSLFAAASESVALTHLGFADENVHSLPPGHVLVVDGNSVTLHKYAESPSQAHCFSNGFTSPTPGAPSMVLVYTCPERNLAKNWQPAKRFPSPMMLSSSPSPTPPRPLLTAWLSGSESLHSKDSFETAISGAPSSKATTARTKSA